MIQIQSPEVGGADEMKNYRLGGINFNIGHYIQRSRPFTAQHTLHTNTHTRTIDHR